MWTAVCKKELRETRWKWLCYAGLLVAVAVLAQAMHGLMQDILGDLGAPGGSALLQAMLHQLDDPFLYHWSNWYAKNLYQMTTLFAILLGMSTVAGEVARGTAAFLFTRPLARTAVLSAKIAGGYGAMATMMVATTLIAMGVAYLGGMALPARFLSGLPIALLGGLVLYLLSVIASILIDDVVKAGAAAAAVMTVLAIPGWVRGWEIYSIYRQMAGVPVLLGEPWPVVPALVLAAAAMGLFALAAEMLKRKEFTR